MIVMALKIWKTRSTFAALSLMLAITSCQREALVEDVTLATQEATSPLETPELAGLEQPMAETRSALNYYVTPTVGTYTPNSDRLSVLPGKDGCASFHGGMIKARVKSQHGNNFVVEIQGHRRILGVNGTAYVKAHSVCGPLAGSKSFTSTTTSVEITITPTFQQGIAHYYPVIIRDSGERYYAEPFLIYTRPAYTMSDRNGFVMATVNGVEIRSSGKGSDINQNGDSNNQCTEFCNRYYRMVYDMDIIDSGTQGGNGNTWFGKAAKKNLTAISNGTGEPKIGDILCFNNKSTGNPETDKKHRGHVAIVTEVSHNEVKIAHQNGGPRWHPVGGHITRSGNTLTCKDYIIQGWLRKK